MKGVGIIGAGVIFDSHAQAWGALKRRARCFAVAEINEQKRAEATRSHFLPVAANDYRELLEREDVDIVCICTPPCFHEEMVCEALEAGKFVVCEKPLAPTLAAIDRIMEVASRYPGRLSTSYQLRYGVDMQKLRWLVEQGSFGKLVSGHAMRRSPLPRAFRGANGWWGRWSVAGGGVVMTQFIHHLDQLICIFGHPQQVKATMSTACQPIESEDTFAATITFSSRAVVTCEGTLNAPRLEWELGIVGEALTAKLPWSLESSDRKHLHRAESELEAKFAAQESVASRVYDRLRRLARRNGHERNAPVNAHEPYFEAVLDAIDAGAPLPIPAEEARRSVELCTAIYTSAITREAVELPLGPDCQFYRGITVDDYRNASATVA